MKTSMYISIIALLCISAPAFSGETVKEASFKTFGNCNQCKTRIEKAMKIPEVKFSRWDKKSKMLKVAYVSDAITLDSLQQRIASVGHDTEKFSAADSVYDALPECCLYRGGDFTH